MTTKFKDSERVLDQEIAEEMAYIEKPYRENELSIWKKLVSNRAEEILKWTKLSQLEQEKLIQAKQQLYEDFLEKLLEDPEKNVWDALLRWNELKELWVINKNKSGTKKWKKHSITFLPKNLLKEAEIIYYWLVLFLNKAHEYFNWKDSIKNTKENSARSLIEFTLQDNVVNLQREWIIYTNATHKWNKGFVKSIEIDDSPLWININFSYIVGYISRSHAFFPWNVHEEIEGYHFTEKDFKNMKIKEIINYDWYGWIYERNFRQSYKTNDFLAYTYPNKEIADKAYSIMSASKEIEKEWKERAQFWENPKCNCCWYIKVFWIPYRKSVDIR